MCKRRRARIRGQPRRSPERRDVLGAAVEDGAGRTLQLELELAAVAVAALGVGRDARELGEVAAPEIVAGERALAPAKYAKGGAVVPSTSEDDWQLSGGAGISSSKQPGAQDVRTGGPGGSPLLINRHPLYGASHRLTTLSFSFRYVAGYGDANSTAKAAQQPPPTQVGVNTLH